eukprot:7669539-Pyramimonas_sp.AAC.1
MQDDHLFVGDKGDIPSDKVYPKDRPCTLVHPELCITAHAWCIAAIERMSKHIFDFVSAFKPGKFIHLRLQGETRTVTTWFCAGYKRGGNPRLRMLTPCRYDDDTLCVRVDCGDDDSLVPGCLNE